MTENQKNISFDRLMARAQNGDNAAYSTLFYNITPLIRSFVYTKIKNTADVEDIVQEILISIHNASHTYDCKRPFKPWMFTIARYRLIDHLRTLYKKREQGQNINFEDLENFLSVQENVTDSYEINEYLSKMMKILPTKQRKIITLMKLQGYSVEDTAKTMKMSVSAVKVSAHRAHKALVLRVKQENDQELTTKVK